MPDHLTGTQHNTLCRLGRIPETAMRALRRVAIWIDMLLLTLAAFSWAGILVVAPYYFLVPAISLVIVIGFVTILASAEKKATIKSQANGPG